MLIVLSPAKALDYETPLAAAVRALPVTQPDFLDDAAQLVDILRQCTPADVAGLMGLSDPLAALNVARYAAWSRPFSLENARPALFAFNGDVYAGLDAPSMTVDELARAQQRLRILSGLYGVLRPLDLMQPYRLEMGTKLATARGGDLYAFWGERITVALNALLERDRAAGGAAVLVNLASAEYFGSVRHERLKGRLVTPVFEDWKDGRYRIISFYAKRARGLMSRYAIANRLDDAAALRGFDGEGYAFSAEASGEDRWVFRRRGA